MLKTKSPQTGYWKNGDLKMKDVLFSFSSQAQKEVIQLVQSLPGELNVEAIDPGKYELTHFVKDLDQFKDVIENGIRFVITRPIEGINPLEQGIVAWLMGASLGNPLDQATDPNGKRYMKVYRIFDRGGRLEKGSRYSYTNQGGDCHTDNVNTEEPWKFMILQSVFSAFAGGGTILVSGLTVHDILEEKYPEQLEWLRKPIFWERKGLGDNTFYEAPVVTYNDRGEPEFRWLPSYALQSNEKAMDLGIPGAKPFEPGHRNAFEVLTALLASAELQFQGDLPQGHILLNYDSQVFHERGHFADLPGSYIPELSERKYDPAKKYGRLRYRMWIKT